MHILVSFLGYKCTTSPETAQSSFWSQLSGSKAMQTQLISVTIPVLLCEVAKAHLRYEARAGTLTRSAPHAVELISSWIQVSLS
jgi:hypothetical protein